MALHASDSQSMVGVHAGALTPSQPPSLPPGRAARTRGRAVAGRRGRRGRRGAVGPAGPCVAGRECHCMQCMAWGVPADSPVPC